MFLEKAANYSIILFSRNERRRLCARSTVGRFANLDNCVGTRRCQETATSQRLWGVYRLKCNIEGASANEETQDFALTYTPGKSKFLKR